MPASREGQRVPEVIFKTRKNGEWVDLSTHALFGGRTVAAFGLPGAFTPTCSSAHLPRFNELAPLFHARGVDAVVCFSVNDAYVMEAWGREQKAEQVTLIPDGNGEFAAGMGMLVDMRGLGFGMRSWRYSMLVRDAVIEKMFIEPERPGDPYEVSDADTLLRHIDPQVRIPEPMTLFTRAGCPFCARAKRLLEARGIPYEEIELGHGITDRSLRAVSGADTTPQVFVGGQRIGGEDDLAIWLESQGPQVA